jgi:hypothetical protein
MRGRTGVLVGFLVTFLVLAPVAGAKKKPKPGPAPGNSGAAHACQKGGYLSLVGADGTTFKNTGKCVSFAAHGGKFATGAVIPAGKVATLSNANWSLASCDALTYGYQLNMGANVAVDSKPGGICVSGPALGATIGPFPTATLLRLFLTDTGNPLIPVACSFTFYSDGSHALVTGTNPSIVDILDSVGCTVGPTVPLAPAGVGLGNIDVTVTVA